ncbi:MAG TPA: SDR family NAD(P)-dependent oxidoreductase [Solirubrobacteraceae bacterium]|nr:SDR family NAD(P)-dependent oxidoreductase [Solirubrobacteraceae bacterium]
MAADLDGQVAVVTGASSGIGEATALALAAQGAGVVLAARREDRIARLAERIESDGGRAIAYPTDLTVEDQARGLILAAREQLGRVDILVNNAGLMLLGPVDGADTSEWRRMISVNLLGLLYCTHAALPIMRDQGGGHIVNLSSVAGRTARAGSAVYNMTKWGVGAFSEALRQEALYSSIRVTVIEPGFVATELQDHNENPVVRETIEKYREQIGEVLEAGDIAEAIVYAVTRPPRVSINEVLVRPTRQPN